GNWVSSPFDLHASFSDNESAVTSCQYTIDGGVTWQPAVVSGAMPAFTGAASGITAANGRLLRLHLRATTGVGTGPGTAGAASRAAAGTSAGRGGMLGGGGFIASRARSSSPIVVRLGSSGSTKRSVIPTRPCTTDGARAELTISASPSIITPPSRKVSANRLR